MSNGTGEGPLRYGKLKTIQSMGEMDLIPGRKVKWWFFGGGQEHFRFGTVTKVNRKTADVEMYRDGHFTVFPKKAMRINRSLLRPI